MLKSLKLNDWNQFNTIDINFHNRITIITGSNGAGKSTLLRLLSKELGWFFEEISRPNISANHSYKFLAGLSPEYLNKVKEMKLEKALRLLTKEENYHEVTEDSTIIGEIVAESGKYQLYVPDDIESASYNLFSTFDGTEHNLKGVNIVSHRQPYSYVKIDNIPLQPSNIENNYSEYLDSLKMRTIFTLYHSTESIKPPVYHMKSALIALAIFGEGNKHVEKNLKQYEIFIGFVKVLKKLLPAHLGFQDIIISNGEVVLITKSGEFLIDAVSGGIGSIIDLAWQIYMFENPKKRFIVLIDEIENHLHPAMQREILPKLLEAFPRVQFVVTTHSPFVVSSVEDSHLYALSYNESHRVESKLLDLKTQSKDALEILREILGVPVTLPVWVEDGIKLSLEKVNNKPLTAENYALLREELHINGLEEFLPEALNLIKMVKDHD